MNPDIYVVIEHLRGQVADISYIMLAAAQELAKGTSGRVVSVLLGHDARQLADDLAAEYTPEAYQRVLTDLISSNQPRAVLFGDTSIGAEVAGGLSARLNLPLVSHCRSVQAENRSLAFTCQICGGKIMAEGEIPSPTALITMMPGSFKAEEGHSAQQIPLDELTCPDLSNLPITLTQYIEPEVGDVDITREAVLVSVGRGIEREDNIDLAEELAEALGGVVCASRPVVDQGWMPVSRLVGKSGKAVKPTVYLALGISGAPEHIEGVSDGGTLIAINTDPNAPIFDVAKYGAEVDLLDLLPVLTEQVQRVRSK
jgi:electron transfer flavoprotein alpha subunit